MGRGVTVVPLRQPSPIGGSEAAAAAGIDPHRSRVMLWLEKSGRFERGESEAMRWGHLLEPVIAAELAERGYTVRLGCPRLFDSERPWVGGTPDGFIDVGDPADPSDGLLEIKTVGAFAARTEDWHDDTIPVGYAAQVQHYLHLTGLKMCLLAVLVGGQRLEVREVPREQKAIDLLLELEREFYEEYLVPDRQPPPGGSDSDREAMAALYPHATEGRVVRLDVEHYGLLGQLRERRAQLAAIESQKQELENLLKSYMGEAEVALAPDDAEAIRWSNVNTRRLDTARLKAEQPETYNDFAAVIPTRRFNVI
jgi:putative phage-type endonuclease